jgi:hypothetical protein
MQGIPPTHAFCVDAGTRGRLLSSLRPIWTMLRHISLAVLPQSCRVLRPPHVSCGTTIAFIGGGCSLYSRGTLAATLTGAVSKVDPIAPSTVDPCTFFSSASFDASVPFVPCRCSGSLDKPFLSMQAVSFLTMADANPDPSPTSASMDKARWIFLMSSPGLNIGMLACSTRHVDRVVWLTKFGR